MTKINGDKVINMREQIKTKCIQDVVMVGTGDVAFKKDKVYTFTKVGGDNIYATNEQGEPNHYMSDKVFFDRHFVIVANIPDYVRELLESESHELEASINRGLNRIESIKDEIEEERRWVEGKRKKLADINKVLEG